MSKINQIDLTKLRSYKLGFQAGHNAGKAEGRRLGWRDLRWWAKGKYSITKHELLEELASRITKPAKRKERANGK